MTTSFDTLPCGYLAFDDSGRIVDINEPLCLLLGYEKPNLLARPVEIIFPVSTKIFFQTHLFPLLKMQGFSQEIFIYLLSKNAQQIPVLLNAKHEQTEGQGISRCICMVVENRKKYEDEMLTAKKAAESALLKSTALQEAKDELSLLAERLEEKIQIITKQNSQLKEFTKIATHDLQEPLRKILLFSDLLLHRTFDSEKQPDFVQKITKAASLMRTKLTGLNQYISLRDAPMARRWINLQEMFELLGTDFTNRLEGNVLKMKIENLPLIFGDYDQLYLLFYHLLKNVIDFRKPADIPVATIKGTVLKLNRYKTPDRYEYVDFLRITVADEGVGFEPKHRHQIFELFNKLDHFNQTGLGLSYCKLIVENHGGFIEADSNPDVGTKITIDFPLAHPRSEKMDSI